MHSPNKLSNPSVKSPWAEIELGLVWHGIDLALQTVLIVIARNHQGCHIEFLADLFSSPPRRIRGWLAQCNRVHKAHPDKPSLFESEGGNGLLYTMDAALAALIRVQDDRWVPIVAHDSPGLSPESDSLDPDGTLPADDLIAPFADPSSDMAEDFPSDSDWASDLWPNLLDNYETLFGNNPGHESWCGSDPFDDLDEPEEGGL